MDCNETIIAILKADVNYFTKEKSENSIIRDSLIADLQKYIEKMEANNPTFPKIYVSGLDKDIKDFLNKGTLETQMLEKLNEIEKKLTELQSLLKS